MNEHLEQNVEVEIAYKIVYGKIVPEHLMRGTLSVVHNHQLAQVASTYEHHIQQNVSKIEDKDHGESVKYQL